MAKKLTLPLALCTPHTHGQLVKDAQWLLHGNGPKFKHAFYHGKIDGVYGPSTASAAKDAKWFLGYPKAACSGKFGQKLYDLLTAEKRLPALYAIRRSKRIKAAKKHAALGGLNAKALGLAATQVGVHEIGASNDNVYGRWYGVNRQPWCAIFCSYVLTHVGRHFRYSYVPTVAADARAHRNGLRAIPYAGIHAAQAAGHPVLACFDWPGESPGTPDHIGFVAHVIDGSNFATIEGNTSASGSQSNGGQVCRKERRRADVHTFVEVL